MPAAQSWPLRTSACDELIQRVASLVDADPPMDLCSHPTTRALIREASPRKNALYKRREDLLDATICAWTAALWHRHGTARCQVLGDTDTDGPDDLVATIIAPARDAQRPAVIT